MPQTRTIHGPQAGLTLMELMLTMMILSIVLGMGVGALSALKVPDSQNTGLVRSVLRAASTQAVSHQANCTVIFDHEAGTMYPAELRVVGTWHFEDSNLDGAFDLNGTGNNVRIVEDGYIGRALSLGRAGSYANFATENDPAFDLTEGFVVEVALRDPDGAGGRILHLGHMVGIDFEPNGVVRGWLAPDLAQDQRASQRDITVTAASNAAHLIVESEAGTVSPGEWVRVRLEYDRTRLVLSVDGRPVDQLESSAKVRELVGNMSISTRDREGFRGDIDKLVVAAVDALEPIQMGEFVTFTESTPRRVVFHGGGGLDPAVHSGPVEIGVEFDQGLTEIITIGLMGTVE